MHHHTHDWCTAGLLLLKPHHPPILDPPPPSIPLQTTKSIAIFCITTRKDCGGLVYCLRREGKSIKKERNERREEKLILLEHPKILVVLTS